MAKQQQHVPFHPLTPFACRARRARQVSAPQVLLCDLPNSLFKPSSSPGAFACLPGNGRARGVGSANHTLEGSSVVACWL
ncbi:Membrane carboxypeptidase [Pseudomonas syringae pv. actinidiae]|uniref:Membrane carboxypeptidase n=1 Tax=Pseudomonas syringae pv. actinidiae TaxID=103796 RepID=A0A2V0QCE5_PSESF|nr:Membrane carboxypeptidase [Pseudomonas syringae pv. actinidiae]